MLHQISSLDVVLTGSMASYTASWKFIGVSSRKGASNK